MLHIGCHLSAAKGYASMGIEALSIKANTFQFLTRQFFTRNPRASKAKGINKNDVAKLRIIMEENNFAPILAHAPYSLNPCSKDLQTRAVVREIVEDDLRRLDQLPCSLYNIHPGSHIGLGAKQGIRLIAEMLNTVITPDQKTTILLETMAGKGSEIGSKFEELKEIIDLVDQKDKIGICMDTCHISDSGYDIINGLDAVLDEFDKVIGLEKIRAIHLNDSLYPTSSHKDRHAKIGEGMIGFKALVSVINHPSLAHLPFFLETPNELSGYAKEIEMLRKAYRH